MMKNFVPFALFACAIATPALASEGDEWTGAYAGVSVGYNNTKSDSAATLGGNWSVEPAGLRTFMTNNIGTKQSVDDFNFGGQIGYNAQVSGNLVLGIEADGAFLNGKEVTVRGPLTVPNLVAPTYNFTNRIDPKASAAIKAKAGIAFDQSLIYATGGWGWTWAKVGTDITSSANYRKASNIDNTFDGWLIGGGIEHKLGERLSLRLDYTYADQGSVTYQTSYVTGSSSTTPAYSETLRQDLRMHQIRAGVNFHF